MEERLLRAAEAQPAGSGPIAASAESDSDEQEKGLAATADAGSSDEPAPWPDDAAESAFLSEQRSAGEPAGLAAGSPAAEAPEEEVPLPGLQELIERIPPQARETLEDLFRAKFIAVRRVPKDALKAK